MKTTKYYPKPAAACPCGTPLSFKPSPDITTEQRVCPACERVHWADVAPVDWKMVGRV